MNTCSRGNIEKNLNFLLPGNRTWGPEQIGISHYYNLPCVSLTCKLSPSPSDIETNTCQLSVWGPNFLGLMGAGLAYNPAPRRPSPTTWPSTLLTSFNPFPHVLLLEMHSLHKPAELLIPLFLSWDPITLLLHARAYMDADTITVSVRLPGSINNNEFCMLRKESCI